MKVIAISAVTAGGKTNEMKKRLPKSCALHFDDYSFEGDVHDFHCWVLHPGMKYYQL